MGYSARPGGPRPATHYERLRWRYVRGEIELEEFEVLVADLLIAGIEDTQAPPPYPGRVPASAPAIGGLSPSPPPDEDDGMWTVSERR